MNNFVSFTLGCYYSIYQMKKLLCSLFIAFFVLQSCRNNEKGISEVVFTLLETGSEASIRGLHVVDENVVWASGSSGTVLATLDGGISWKRHLVPGAEKNDFRSIYAWDEKRVLVFGISGSDFGYLSENGGATWDIVFQDTTKGLFFNSLKFADEKNGLAVSDPVDGKFFIIRTQDGGRSWSRIVDLPEVEEGEANFAASNTCIEFLPGGRAWMASGGKAARVFYSDDFGQSWDVSKTPMIRGQSSSGIFSVSFKNERQGIIVGGIYDHPELNTNIAAYTLDGGKSWLPAERMPREYRSCVQQINRGEMAIAIGKTGSDISYDGGANWAPLNDSGFYTFRAVPGKMEGFAAGANGQIAKVIFVKD